MRELWSPHQANKSQSKYPKVYNALWCLLARSVNTQGQALWSRFAISPLHINLRGSRLKSRSLLLYSHLVMV